MLMILLTSFIEENQQQDCYHALRNHSTYFKNINAIYCMYLLTPIEYYVSSEKMAIKVLLQIFEYLKVIYSLRKA